MLQALALAIVVATGIPPAGDWRLESQHTKVRVLSWGLFCGKEPRDARGIPGALYTLKGSGDDFTMSGGGKQYGTTACGADAAEYKVRQRDHSGSTWKIDCEVAGGVQPLTSEHRFEQTSPTEIRYVARGERRKKENLDACRFAYETEIRFVLASEAGPCAQPGPAAKLVLDPASRDVTPGQRVCFKVQAVDAKSCAVETPQVTFSVEPADMGDLDGQGCYWAPREVTQTAVAAVKASGGAAQGNALLRLVAPGEAPKEAIAQTVAKAKDERIRRLGSEVLAGDFTLKTPQEEEDDLPAVPVDKPKPWWLYGAAGAGLMLVAVAWLLMRRKPAPQRPAAAAVPVEKPVPPKAGMGFKCPQCGFEFESEGKCPHDGSELVVNAEQGRMTMFIPAIGGMVCPTCGTKYPARARFCGHDRSPLVPDVGKP